MLRWLSQLFSNTPIDKQYRNLEKRIDNLEKHILDLQIAATRNSELLSLVAGIQKDFITALAGISDPLEPKSSSSDKVVLNLKLYCDDDFIN